MVKRLAANKYVVCSKDGKKVIGTHTTKAAAYEQEASIRAKLERSFLYGGKA